MLKVQFLGTGTSQGIPVIGSHHPVNFSTNSKDKRLRSSVLLSKHGKNLTIDCGPDFRYQMLRANVRNLEGILFTHEHNDHVLGLDDTRSFIHFAQKPMDIFACPRTLGEIKTRFPYAFAEEKYPGAPSFTEHILDGSAFEFAGFVIEPLPILHGKLPIYGFLIDKKFAYITDASFISEEILEKIKNVDALVLNALRKVEKHHSHFTLEEALEITSIVEPKQAYFTHISLTLGFHDEVQAELPENIFLAFDGLEIEI
ncbi:MBL fold metallo-hydrolase [Moheibacter stercoris]|uniref:Phosphoribosyl 1,2-cyclic phosphate phosphodiesterase n=1 Tax=Moheibacter stercoris TaxID=1628251 RepID=A0ABV2LSH8_9FLAO